MTLHRDQNSRILFPRRQAVEILREPHPLTGRGRLVFPGARSNGRPMSYITRARASSQRPSNRNALGFRELAQFVAQGLAPGRLFHDGRDKIFRLTEIGREHHGFDGSD
jgi:hypothetical protein